MSKILNLSLLLSLCIGPLQCVSNPVSPTSSELTPAEKHLVESDNKFGLKLFREIIKEEKDKNVFISPLSVSMALGMAYNGANESTQKAMQITLELSGLTIQEVNESYKSLIELLTGLDPKVRFQIANSIWYSQEFSFEDEFINLNEKYFNAEVTGLDFNDPNAADIINNWVDENTKGKIKEIVDKPIDPMTVMFLINAIYFKGTWTYEFDEELTHDDWFKLSDGTRKPCKMMAQSGEYKYFSNDDFQAVNIPYGDADFTMTIFLPHPQKNIDSLIAEFNQDNWIRWINSFSTESGNISIPKFTLEYELVLNEALHALGMGIAFDPYLADFSRMCSGTNSFFISKVKHKTFVEVNEEGTEAAAVTSIVVEGSSVGPSGFTMRVDRPFVFVIQESRSQSILFMGKITEPTFD